MILALDIGSGSVRAGLVDRDGSYPARWSRQPGLPIVDEGSMRHSVDLRALMAQVTDLLRAALEECRRRGTDLLAVTCTAIRYAFVLQGRKYPATSWANTDRAAAGLLSQLREQHEPEAVLATGGYLTPLSMSTRLAWALSGRQLPAGDAPLVVPLHAWVLMQLGAEPHCDISSASDARLADLATGTWRTPPSGVTMPPIVNPGEVVGRLGAGLSRGARVDLIAGAGDSYAALAAVPNAAPGDAVVVAGTTTPVLRLLCAPGADLHAAVASAAEAVTADVVGLGVTASSAQGRVLVAERNVTRSGHVTSWLARILGAELATLEGEAAEIAVPEQLHCHLGPSVSPPSALGLPAVRRSFELTSAGEPLPDRATLYRAAVEANAWASAHHITQVLRAPVMGSAADDSQVFVVGGQSQSPVYLQALASALGRPVAGGPSDASLIGAAQAAWRSRGVEVGGVVGRDQIIDPGGEDAKDRCAAWVRRQHALAGLSGPRGVSDRHQKKWGRL